MVRILQGSPEVADLLDPVQPFVKAPKYIRADLYDYHYTRPGRFGDLEPGCYGADRKAVPGCKCHGTCSSCGWAARPTGASDCIACADPRELVHSIFADGTGKCVTVVNQRNATAWWTRQKKGEYLPPVSLDELDGFMKDFGLKTTSPKNTCKTPQCHSTLSALDSIRTLPVRECKPPFSPPDHSNPESPRRLSDTVRLGITRQKSAITTPAKPASDIFLLYPRTC